MSGRNARHGAGLWRVVTRLVGEPAPATGWHGAPSTGGGAEHDGVPGRFRPGSRAFDLLLIALAAFALRAPSMSLSVFGSGDESAFVLAAREVVLGHVPYVTFWDHKPLGSTLLIAAAMAVLGQSIEAVRAVGMACVIATSCCLYLIAQRVSPWRLVPLAAGLLYVAYSTRLAGGIATITEVTFAPFTAAGVLLLMAVPGRRGALGLASTFAAAGLAFGIATWIKYVPAVPAAFVGAMALVAVLQQSRGFAAAAACGAAFAAGLLLPTAASMAWYWWMGLFDVFWYANFGFMAQYATESGFQDHVRGALFYALRCITLVVLDLWPLLATAAVAFLPACLVHLFAPGRAYHSALIVVWLASEMLAVTMQMKFYMYHFLPLLPPLCVLSAVAIRAHVDRLALPQKAALVTVLAVAFTAFGPVIVHARAVAAALSRPDVPREIAKLVAPGLGPAERVFVVNYESIIYFLADAALPTRAAFPVLLTGPHMSVSPDDTRAEVRRILDGKPKFIVFNLSWRDAPVPWDPELMGMVEEVVARDYAPHATWTLAESMGTVVLFTRRN